MCVRWLVHEQQRADRGRGKQRKHGNKTTTMRVDQETRGIEKGRGGAKYEIICAQTPRRIRIHSHCKPCCRRTSIFLPTCACLGASGSSFFLANHPPNHPFFFAAGSPEPSAISDVSSSWVSGVVSTTAGAAGAGSTTGVGCGIGAAAAAAGCPNAGLGIICCCGCIMWGCICCCIGCAG